MPKKREGYKQINIYVPEDLHIALKTYATAQGETLTQWVVNEFRQKMIEVGYIKPELDMTQYETLSDLLIEQWDIIEANAPKSKLPALKSIRDGEAKPTEVDIVRLSAYLGVDECQIVKLAKKSNRSKTNGNV